MKEIRKYLLPVSGFTIVLVALLFVATAGQAVPSDKDVRVVNTTAEPVPTAAQGTTVISGNVSLASGTNVGIDPASNTVKVASTIVPFQIETGATQTTPSNVSTLNVTTVPAGKRLVIEFVTVVGQVPQGEHVELIEITTSTGGHGASHQLLINPQPDAVIGDALFRASQTVKIYADAGTQVTSILRRNTNVGSASFGLTISGYLVDM